MQTVSCPGCGAPVTFKSHASVMAVCEFCQAAVIKDAAAVGDLGKMSSVLEDYSPIQINTAGVFEGRPFTVVGRIQLRYAHGMWNEWFLLFNDAGNGWLGDASGQYMVTTESDVDGSVVPFGQIAPAQHYTFSGLRYTVADHRVADCIGGQGELPFRVGQGWQSRTVDLRAGGAFLTLDYSDAELPTAYRGKAVKLEQLQCQLLRDDEQIKASAGRYRGRLDVLDCPSCGGAIKYLPGLATQLVCPACQARLDASGPEATVLAAGERVEGERTTLALGAVGKIGGSDYTIMGVMRRLDDEDSAWTEYLLHNPAAGFKWLVETDEGWSFAEVLDTWPEWNATGGERATLDQASYTKLYDYEARVEFVAGAFNWRVAAGDAVQVYEFERGSTSLAAELSDTELTWTRSTKVAFDQLAAWFGNGTPGAPAQPAKPASAASTSIKFFVWLLLLNAIPLMFNFGRTAIYLLLGGLAIWLPYELGRIKKKDGANDG
ncbi:DUF4178 domain-containing protein [Massilia glaciei]|uniref:DUF4178 domain-containing protein n=1 Tax=Massilia glaciei TaxID=1524097 RepID=A0A2U2HEK7_9BURK|nr:DUF4178 domain-containing protein [Massilia glaciei]PWF42069.1 DUF4178 domain-containing protein [Massilia glaciei]